MQTGRSLGQRFGVEVVNNRHAQSHDKNCVQRSRLALNERRRCLGFNRYIATREGDIARPDPRREAKDRNRRSSREIFPDQAVALRSQRPVRRIMASPEEILTPAIFSQASISLG